MSRLPRARAGLRVALTLGLLCGHCGCRGRTAPDPELDAAQLATLRLELVPGGEAPESVMVDGGWLCRNRVFAAWTGDRCPDPDFRGDVEIWTFEALVTRGHHGLIIQGRAGSWRLESDIMAIRGGTVECTFDKRELQCRTLSARAAGRHR